MVLLTFLPKLRNTFPGDLFLFIFLFLFPGDLVQRLWEDFRDGPGPDDGEGGNLGVETQSAAAVGLWQLQVFVSLFCNHHIMSQNFKT